MGNDEFFFAACQRLSGRILMSFMGWMVAILAVAGVVIRARKRQGWGRYGR